MRTLFLLALLFANRAAQAVSVPGGQVMTAEALPARVYELVVSPSYFAESGGGYLSARLRSQIYRSVGMGIGFGTGASGVHFGADGFFHLASQRGARPALAVLTSLYLTRESSTNYMVFRAGPMASYTLRTGFGTCTPYAGLHLTPQIRLEGTRGTGEVASALGGVVQIADLGGMQLWAEWARTWRRPSDEYVFGISYPFTAL